MPWCSCSCLLFELQFEVYEGGHTPLGVLVYPPVMDEPDRDWVEEMQLFSARATGDHEPGVLQDAQVLHHAETGHFENRLELCQRQAVVGEEPVEQGASRWVGERLEHPVVVIGHISTIRDQMVTCQPRSGNVRKFSGHVDPELARST